MDYTLSDHYVTDPTTGHRRHDLAGAIPTEVSDLDINSIIWSMMEVVTAGGQAPAQFDPTNSASYRKFKLALDALYSNSTPSGIVVPFAGETPPSGWLECDGSSLLRASYAGLFAAIGTLHGAADGTHFNLPDHRGRFLRGWNHGSSNDADAAARTASNVGGATGNHVGTLQGDAIRNITGTLDFISGGGLGGTGAFSVPHAYGNQISAGVVGSQPIGATFNASGSVPTGSDNRPANASVMFIIKI